ncbi:hypothetical protein BRARA_I01558 [Brassica rapa]|uniref:Uncharacterized protein n=1 Tax=Brassica campestris TaxID=3711 RepID=A0A397Y2K1_BRACM|nr:hypothetical protein BRARA_I01558 [Brassica rapa]
MTRRRFDKVEHFDKDSGSDSSCLSSDSDPEEVEESEEEVSEEGDESPGVACFHISLCYPLLDEKSDIDDDDEPPEEEDEHYILGCMIKCQSGYECRYCPFITCPNERTMRAHVSSTRHTRLERIMKRESPGPDDVDYDDDGYDLETHHRRTDDNKVVDDPETPSQVWFSDNSRKCQKEGVNSDDATQKSRKKMRQTKD